MNKNEKTDKEERELWFYIMFEVALLFGVFFLTGLPFVIGGVGGNVTVTTELTVGNVFPEVLNVSINNYSNSLTLTANTTISVGCEALIRDFNNWSDFDSVVGQFFSSTNSTYGNATDNNHHYTNNTCVINNTFGTWNGIANNTYNSLANCSFEVQYYAVPTEWNCTVVVNDTYNLNNTGSSNTSIDQLLALVVADTINYGTVNATEVSFQNITNVSNAGNVDIDLALHGYGVNDGDNLSMNCSLGSDKNITIEHTKFNLTNSSTGLFGSNLSAFESNYTNLSGTVNITTSWNQFFRKNDSDNEATDETYWRIYVPQGVAGTCKGNIVFGAVIDS